MLLIVGLGNPGARYARTRHNAGFLVVEQLSSRVHAGPWREKFSGEFVKCAVGQEDCILLKPMTYMNESGRSVQAAMAFFRVDVSDLVVVHDELDLDFATIRLKRGGGHAGHNGLRSIVGTIDSGDFARLRIGIGHPPRGWQGEVADYVLSEMGPDERAEFPAVVEKAVDALVLVGKRGVAASMNALNVRPKKPRPAEAAAKDSGNSSDDDKLSVASEPKER